jgi:hypothetical protein
MNAFEAAEKKSGRADDLQRELETLFNSQNKSPLRNATSIPATFLRVTLGGINHPTGHSKKLSPPSSSGVRSSEAIQPALSKGTPVIIQAVEKAGITSTFKTAFSDGDLDRPIGRSSDLES